MNELEENSILTIFMVFFEIDQNVRNLFPLIFESEENDNYIVFHIFLSQQKHFTSFRHPVVYSDQTRISFRSHCMTKRISLLPAIVLRLQTNTKDLMIMNDQNPELKLATFIKKLIGNCQVLRLISLLDTGIVQDVIPKSFTTRSQYGSQWCCYLRQEDQNKLEEFDFQV